MIATARLLLQPLREDDADEMAPVLGDVSLHAFTGGQPLTTSELRARFRRLVRGHSDDGSEEWLNWIIRVRAGGAAVGTVQATITGNTAWIAWVVGVPWQGQGIATEATIGLVAWLGQRGLAAISACIHPSHVASQRVAQRAGLALTPELVDGEQVWRRTRTMTSA